ncbi:hypothetical protein GPL15_08580 [Clostridium sp. MCC353]|uniref:hypothetical protein n=1 Tax=Clostridium sp. MCC353 TaxID=2592646 RepID=UPI001C02C26F|nr:hypothetical protein [Clostridium sp. MCC353]MBT9776558.1 hypothetical protein [Clostridium sp. MCC353]
MKEGKGCRVKVVHKLNDFSEDYQEGDLFTVEDTWYGGVHVRSLSGIPVSLCREEYEIVDEEESGHCAVCGGRKAWMEKDGCAVKINENGDIFVSFKDGTILSGTVKYCPECGRRMKDI